ncbi:ABC transporter substrate-binding protein [Hominifimenecus sp. rT4P-3]|uniref:ABC transporter substrate-binding protein n=1 Tax=Hominifimenecus sp. rT4P-3 TaxID=3242979 RepID=UPI003DA52004
MKKAVAFCLALTMAAGLLTGCGSGKEATGAAETGSKTTTAVTTEATTTAAETTTAAATEATTAAETTAAAIAPEDAVVRIGSLKGPTSMGLVSMMQNNPDMYFQMETAADALTAAIVKGDLDIALVPANIAAILYNKNTNISVIDINTLSVLYVVAKDNSIQSIQDLKGKTIYLTGKGTTPDYVFQYLLKANGLSVEDVKMEYKSEATEVVSMLAQDDSAIGLLPQPFVTVACSQTEGLNVVLDLGKEWETAQKESEMPSSLVTGVTIVRNAFLEEHPDVVIRFMEEHEKSAAYTNENPAEAAEMIAALGIVAKAPVAEKAIPKCGITYLDGMDMIQALAGYLQALYEENPAAVGGEAPSTEMYASGLR